MNKNLQELTEDELKQVAGGGPTSDQKPKGGFRNENEKRIKRTQRGSRSPE